MKKKLLIATDNRYWRKSLGSQHRISSLIEHLNCQDIDITVFFTGNYYENDRQLIKSTGVTQYTPNDYAKDKSILFKLKKIVLGFKYRLKKWLYRGLDFLKRNLTDTSPILDDYKNLHTKSSFLKLIAEINPDAVLIEFVRLSYLIESPTFKAGKKPILFIDTHDVSYTRHASFKESNKSSDLRITKSKEKKLLNQFDHVLAIQLEDQKALREICDTNIIHTPHAIPIKTHTGSVNLNQQDCLNIGFIGSSMPPNIHGINLFIDTVLSKLSKVRLHIFGSLCGKLTPSDNKVTLHGYIDDLDSAYQACHIMINPVTFGGGLKIKSVEALAFGKPLVSSDEGVRGMPPSSAFIICNTPDEWIRAIEKLENNQYRAHMAEQARAYAESHYSKQAAYAPFINELLKT